MRCLTRMLSPPPTTESRCNPRPCPRLMTPSLCWEAHSKASFAKCQLGGIIHRLWVVRKPWTTRRPLLLNRSSQSTDVRLDALTGLSDTQRAELHRRVAEHPGAG